jgi:hypothetical protein
MKKKWIDLLFIVVVVLLVLLVVARAFTKTIGNTIAVTQIKTKVNINAKVRGQVEHPKHPFVVSFFWTWERNVSFGNIGAADPWNVCPEPVVHRWGIFNSSDDDN